MTIGHVWSPNRFLRLKAYLWARYLRCCTTRWRQLREDQPQAYNRYVKLDTALIKRQGEKTC